MAGSGAAICLFAVELNKQNIMESALRMITDMEMWEKMKMPVMFSLICMVISADVTSSRKYEEIFPIAVCRGSSGT